MFRYKAKIVKIVDGDTIDLMIDLGFDIWIKERVRLYGLDAPETRTRDLEEKKKGLETKDFVVEKLERYGTEIEVETSKGEGKFGRYLAVIFYKSEFKLHFMNLNEELIREGLAKEYYGGKR